MIKACFSNAVTRRKAPSTSLKYRVVESREMVRRASASADIACSITNRVSMGPEVGKISGTKCT